MKQLLLAFTFSVLLLKVSSQEAIRATEKELRTTERALPPISAAGPIRRAWDFSNEFPPVMDQCTTNNCVSFACSYYLYSYLYGRDIRKSFLYKSKDSLDKTTVFSPYYPFFYKKNGDECSKSASSVLQTLYFMRSSGTTLLHDFDLDPCDQYSCDKKPDPSIDVLAANYKVKNFAFIYSDLFAVPFKPTDLIKRFLFVNTPVVVLIDVDDDFKNIKNRNEDYVWDKDMAKGDNWHAMVCTGYDLDKDALRFVNSYSSKWGYDGKLWISNNYINSHIGEAYVANVDKNLIINSKTPTVLFVDSSQMNKIVVPNQNTIDIYNKEFQLYKGLLISAATHSNKLTDIRIIQKGSDNLEFINTLEIKNSAAKEVNINGDRYNIDVMSKKKLSKDDMKLLNDHVSLKIDKINDK